MKEVSVEVVQPGQVDAVVLEVGDPEPVGEKNAPLMTKSQSSEFYFLTVVLLKQIV